MRSGGEEQAGERLKRTALRDFKPLPEGYNRGGTSYKLAVDRQDAPVPALMRYALTLIGLRAHGPSEKVAWSVPFAYRGQCCSLFHQSSASACSCEPRQVRRRRTSP